MPTSHSVSFPEVRHALATHLSRRDIDEATWKLSAQATVQIGRQLGRPYNPYDTAAGYMLRGWQNAWAQLPENAQKASYIQKLDDQVDRQNTQTALDFPDEPLSDLFSRMLKTEEDPRPVDFCHQLFVRERELYAIQQASLWFREKKNTTHPVIEKYKGQVINEVNRLRKKCTRREFESGHGNPETR